MPRWLSAASTSVGVRTFTVDMQSTGGQDRVSQTSFVNMVRHLCSARLALGMLSTSKNVFGMEEEEGWSFWKNSTANAELVVKVAVNGQNQQLHSFPPRAELGRLCKGPQTAAPTLFLLYTFRPLLLSQWGNLLCRRGSAIKPNSRVARYYASEAAEVCSNETHCKRILSRVSYSTNKGWVDVFAEFLNLLMNTCALFHQPKWSHCLVNGLCTWSCIAFLRVVQHKDKHKFRMLQRRGPISI